MKKRYTKPSLVISLVGFLVIASVGGWAMRKAFTAPGIANITPLKKGPVTPVVDEILLKRLSEVLEVFTPAEQQYTFAGTMSVTDLADSSQNIRQQAFLIARKHNDFYIKQGNTETLSSTQTLIKLDHGSKKIFVSHPSTVNQPVLIDVATIRNAVTNENYQLTSRMDGSLQTLSLINEHHFSCKQYTITYDTLAKRIVRIFSRLADPMEPLNRRKEKSLTIDFRECASVADLGRYPSPVTVLADNGQLRKSYRDYQLIVY